MAETTTITKPAPIIEGSLTAFLKSIDKLGAGAIPAAGFTGIDTSVYDPKVAQQTQLQKDVVTRAAGLDSLTGPQAYQQFMSPYQQEVIDTTLAEFDRNQAIQNTAMRDQAIQAGAFGGARQGVMAAESARGAATNRANLQAQLLAQGFQQAQAAAAQDLASKTRFRSVSICTRSTTTSCRTSWIRCSTDRSKRSRVPTIHTIRIDWSTTCTNSTRSIPDSNSRICTTSSSG
jgi:hypothetical protein